MQLYWRKLKHRLNIEENESVASCNQLKLKTSNGKYYNNDIVDVNYLYLDGKK